MESTKKISLFIVVFLGLLTAITPLGTDLYLPALPIMPHELNTNASLIQMTIGIMTCLLYTSPSPRDGATSRMPSSA